MQADNIRNGQQLFQRQIFGELRPAFALGPVVGNGAHSERAGDLSRSLADPAGSR